MSKVLVIAAHPDDELLGCGGTLIKHVQQGDEVRCLLMCEGESLRYVGQNIQMADSTEQAAKVIGFSQVVRCNFPDQRLDTFSLVDIIKPIEQTVDSYEPDIVYVQNGEDINRDHQIVYEAASVALRPTAPSVKEIYTFYTVGSTEWNYPAAFRPNVFVNIEEQLEKKLEAFRCYHSEVREYPHPRSEQAIRNLAAYTGNQCCMKAAEAFMLIRKICH